jgi:hypothetical protein
MRGRLVIAFLFWGMVIFESVLPSSAQDDKEVLTAAARNFLEAKVKGDQATIYKYLSSEERGELTEEQFLAQMRGKEEFQFLSYKLGAVETAKDIGWVETETTAKLAKYPSLPPRTVHRWEVWRKRGDDWRPLSINQEDEAPKLPPSLRPAEEEAVLARRANDFWEAKEKGNWNCVYQFCEPKFRESVSSEEFLQKKALYSYLSHQIEWAEVSGDRGRTRCTYRYAHNDPSLAKMDPLQGSIIEEWVKVEGAWYREIKEPK